MNWNYNLPAMLNLRMSKFLRSRSGKGRRGSDDNQLAAEEGFSSPAKDSSNKLNVKSLMLFWQGLIQNPPLYPHQELLMQG